MKLLHSSILVAHCFLAIAARAQTTSPTALPPAVETQLRALVNDPALRQAQFGVSIKALGTADTAQTFPAQAYVDAAQPLLWEQDGQKRFIPASNTKLYTAALALKYLGAGRTFPTRLAFSGTRQGDVLKGNLWLVGGGDPSLSSLDLHRFAAALQKLGIRCVTGDVIGDGSAFQSEGFGGRYPDGWTLDDTLWYYGMETSALAINRNQVDVTVEATQPGQLARVTAAPSAPDFINARVETRSPGSQAASATPQIQWERASGDSAIAPFLSVTGVIFPNQKESQGVAVPNPPRWAAQILKRALWQRGVRVEGVARGRVTGDKNEVLHTLSTHYSPPLQVLLANFLKPSDNLYGEMLLRGVSYYAPQPKVGFRPGTQSTSHALLFDWMRQSGIEIEGLRFTDGSGLSRYNLITPRATVQLLAEAEKLPGSMVFWDGLPIAGVDGTLRRRMRSTAEAPNPAQGNVRAKTGSFSIVSTLSGYVTTRDGHRLAVSLLTNFAPGDEARRVQNQIMTLLASCSWKEEIS
jgi:D-alanyl-D-alanine carboxypeptidase/D-alanyl-D-alanine-endopeptidase (penicillin-binding protein 4)